MYLFVRNPSGKQITRIKKESHSRGNIAGADGVVHQEAELAGKIAAADTVHIPEVGSVHANQQVVFLVIGIGKLPRYVTVAGDPMFCQLATRWRINWVMLSFT